MSKESTIKCPNCNAQIDVNEVLYHQLENKYKHEHLAQQKKLEAEIEAKRKEYKTHLDALKVQEEALKEQKEKFDEELQKATKELLKQEKSKLHEQLKKEILEEQSESMAALKKELEVKSHQVKELNNAKVQIGKLQREKEEMESAIMAKAELTLNEKLKLEKAKIQKTLDEQNELKFKQKEQQLEQLKKQLQEAQRKAEQGSQQLQGETQELAIEEYLQDKYPFDAIEEIKKGARGGDCIQIVHTREIQNCGKIYYESKRTKDFQKSWIEKLKADMRDKGADIGVLVTEVLPKEFDRMGLIDGVWICTFEEFKGLSSVLRESIVTIHQAKKSQENKTDKMSLLYSYLTSTEFKMQIEAIVEGFTQMQSDLDSEKRSMQRIWKQREKQIEKVLENTIGMYGSIKGVAGNSIGNIKALELPYSEGEGE
ncbi:MAG: Caldesmon [Sulfurovum sp. FS08-3]|nr:MAG: Caldesmon [Sulfurovum sp. FS08-3]